MTSGKVGHKVHSLKRAVVLSGGQSFISRKVLHSCRTVAWTVVDEFDKRLGVIMDQYREDLEAADAKQDAAMDDLHHWFNENYNGMHNIPWPKEVV